MQEDFHYYATYCAAYIAGYSHEESLELAYSAQFTDCCSRTLLSKLGGPSSAATTQLQLELMDAGTDLTGLQDITRIWASFHFLPYDLYAEKEKRPRGYMNKYRLICNANGPLVSDTVKLAQGRGIQAAGIAMHVLADTWAHRYFAGTPSLVINNTDYYFFELTEDGKEQIDFRHSVSEPDDIENRKYTNSVHQTHEHSIMNLGHGRAGHLPDYSFIRYEYLPAWNDYVPIVKDNPSDYLHAFCQMIYAMKYLRGEIESFETEKYAFDAIASYEEEIKGIIGKRQLDASADWKAFGEKLSGMEIEAFDMDKYQEEYMQASDKDGTYLGGFFDAAMAQKSMVTGKIFRSGNLLAGYSVDYRRKGFRGITDYIKVADRMRKDGEH